MFFCLWDFGQQTCFWTLSTRSASVSKGFCEWKGDCDYVLPTQLTGSKCQESPDAIIRMPLKVSAARNSVWAEVAPPTKQFPHLSQRSCLYIMGRIQSDSEPRQTRARSTVFLAYYHDCICSTALSEIQRRKPAMGYSFPTQPTFLFLFTYPAKIPSDTSWRKTNSSKVRRIYWHKIRPCTWLTLLLFPICDDVSSRKQLETAFFITHFSTIILFTANVFFGRTLLIFSSHSAFSCALLSVFNSAI